ncbi:hypothetical protein [Nostoc sp.]|uniref:hypothetical protein n=1 Tax=Nostoc sp. TaxID=1180 RepID=UPI002FF96FFB
MGFYECSKLIPVGGFVPIAPMRSDFGIKVTRFPPMLKPYIDSITTDVEEFTGFATLHPIGLIASITFPRRS